MSYADTMRTWSNINCGLQSMVSYTNARNNGENPQVATVNLFSNLCNGFARNEVAYQMQRFGNPAGNMINMYSGYGNPISNYVGTVGLMNAFTPWMFFNSPFCGMGMGCFGGYYGMGMSPYMGLGWGMGGFWC